MDDREPTEMADDGFEEVSEVPMRRRASRAPWVLFVLALVAGAAAAAWLLLRLDEARGAAAAESAQKAELSQRLEKMEAEKSDLVSLRNELSLQVQAKDEEIAKLQGTYDELQAKMKAEIEKGDIRLSQAGGRIKVDLVDKILFDTGDASISERGGEVLSRVGAVLANVKDRKIQVSGHTDDLPIHERLRDRYPTNWELAATRATNVVRSLEEKANVPGRVLVAAAYGPWEPISSNKTPSGRARNRRIEIVLAPALAPAPAEGTKVAAVPAAASAPAPKAAATRPASAKPAAKKAPAKPAAKVSAKKKKRT